MPAKKKITNKQIADKITIEEDLKAIGRKFDQDKPRWSLLPWKEVEEIVKVLTLGSKKYADHNWMGVRPFKDRYTSALMRHITAWIDGEAEDPESKLSHLAHAGCCLLFLMWGDNNLDKDESEFG
jgi:hypothetical protein